MSEAYAAAHIAQELGITVLADDVPKIVAAIHRAYAVLAALAAARAAQEGK